MPFAEVHSFCALASAIDDRDMTADATPWPFAFLTKVLAGHAEASTSRATRPDTIHGFSLPLLGPAFI